MERLKEKLSERNDLHLKPIIVTPDKEIIDGQHRFQAAKELGLNIYFLIDYDFEPEKLIIHNTSQKEWACSDSFRHFLEMGNDNYFLFKKLLEKHEPMNMETLLFILKRGCNYANIRKDFREGRFKFEISAEAHKTLNCYEILKVALSEKGFKGMQVFRDKKFIESIYRFFTHPRIDEERFFSNLDRKPFSFTRHSTVVGFLLWMADVYNYNKSKEKVQIFVMGSKVKVQVQ